ncbi:MAG: hypothetical protein WC530_05320 [Candidatus Omnitrophota bacterium]|jgi:hypothetical protein
MKKIVCMLCIALYALSFGGCVRLAGGTGYWKTGASGETTAKKIGFDTADYVPGSPAPDSNESQGSITT